MNLKYTRDQVRARQVGYIGVKGVPAAWWPYGASTNDCLAFQLFCLGTRARGDVDPKFISISAFRAAFGWNEVSRDDLKPGDLVCENWSSPVGTEAQHIEYVYSVDHDSRTITTISANTGPQPGIVLPRGVWKKTRPLDEHFLFGIEPPYADDTASTARKKQVRLNAAFLNSWSRESNGPTSAAASDGIEGPVYWGLVQAWGRVHNALGKPGCIYGPTYVVDRVPGPRTRYVEGVINKLAKAAAK